MLKRLVIGLIDQGVRLTRIVPDRLEVESVLATERSLELVPRLQTPMKVLPWLRGRRAEELATAMERSLPDVIYATGRASWPIAIDLADEIERPIALDIWSSEIAANAPRNRSARNIAGYVAATAPLATALRQRVDSELVSLVPIGVAVPSSPPKRSRSADDLISAAIVGSGQDLPAYRTVLAALERIHREINQLQVVLELRGPHEHDIWRLVDRSGMHPFISPIRDAAMHRRLVSQCDVLITPESCGEVNSLLLDCMAVGMTLVACEDSVLDMLEHDITAIMLPRQQPDAWEGRLRRALGNIEVSRHVGAAARSVIARHHRSSQHVARLAETFEKIVSGETYSFERQIA